MKKLFVRVMLCCLVFSCFTFKTVRLNAATSSGYVNSTVKWSYDAGSSTVTITGKGVIDSYLHYSDGYPIQGGPIKNLVISEGITGIENSPFEMFEVERVILPNSLKSLGSYALMFANSDFSYEGMMNYPVPEVMIPDSVTNIALNGLAGIYAYVHSTHPVLRQDGYSYGSSGIYFLDDYAWGAVYAVLQDDGTLVFVQTEESYENKTIGTVTDLKGDKFTGIIYQINGYQFYDSASDVPWDLERSEIRRVYAEEGVVFDVGSFDYWFKDCINLISFDLSGFSTTYLNTANYMFSGCTSLKSVDFSNIDMTSMYEMKDMFKNCNALSTINLGIGFINWVDNAYLPAGTWYHGSESKTSQQLYSLFPTNSQLLSGVWTRNHVEADDYLSVYKGDSIQINASTVVNSGSPTLSYSSSNTSVATVTSTGVVKGIKKGEAKITVSASGSSVISAVVDVKVVDELAATETTTGKLYGKGILVEWDPVEGAAGYVVYRRAMRKGETEWTKFDRWNNTTGLSFLDTKVYEGTKYQYGVKAYYGTDPSTTKKLGPVGPMSKALVYAKKPGVTEYTYTENVYNGIRIEWEAVPKATGYIIYRRALNSSGTGWTTFERWNSTTDTNWTDTKVYAGTKYQYGIKAYYGADPKAMSYVGNVGDLCTEVRITNRKFLSVYPCENTDGTWTIRVKWDASSAFTGYELYIVVYNTDYYGEEEGSYIEKEVLITNPKTTQYSLKVSTDYDYASLTIRSYKDIDGVRYYGQTDYVGFGLDECEDYQQWF